jgi:hypothetical protein
MALIPNFEICQSSDCKTLTFVETTGAYNAGNNTTGWNAPNATIAAATAAVLTVTYASGTIATIDLFATTIFPTALTTVQYDLTSTSLGLVADTAIDDQIITFTYTVTSGGTSYHQTKRFPFTCQVRCCVQSMVIGIDIDCDCSDDIIEKYTRAYILYKGLIYSGNAGNVSNFNNILAQLQKLCLNSNCENCN